MAATFNLTYGLYVLTARDQDKDNGCIINTAFQVASEPLKIAVSCQKGNLTREMIEKTGAFNLSVLTNEVPFETIRHFGMQTGRETDKFADRKEDPRSAGGIRYFTEYTNACFSVKVTDSLDLGSHRMFIGEVVEAKTLNKKPSCTYAFYHSDIKPKK